MRTNIVLDEGLLKKAMRLSNRIKTKREMVTVALKEYVQNHGRLDLRELRGKVAFDKKYDHKALREGKLK